MSDKVVVLITGANRVAGVRDPDSVSSQNIQMLPCGMDTQVIVVKLDSTSETDARAAVETLTSKYSLTKLDIVVANAGISKYFGAASVTPAQEMSDHFVVNTIAPLLLFQATAPLLKAAPAPRFVVVSSGAGSLSQVVKLPVENTAYGASKAAVNFVSRRIHYENPYLTAFALNPGWLQTELGNHAARGVGMAAAPVSIQDGVNGMIEQIDRATREGSSGKFLSIDGEEIPW
ncbi:Norsolorinic acid ketoreductase [Cladophialophora carrionii]|uniref:Norsolorinic acid ketoreductase n=1 Tax=Cladophialophora carrionii TaxID=86049 RepID=A0A1C1D2B5_9EURO|nr:Norsolorinic acid ketoreductase [Cladophialophora carrionii]